MRPLKERLYTENVITKNNRINTAIAKFPKFKKIYSEILAHTSFLPEDASIKERIYCIVYDINEILYCSKCTKNKAKFQGNFTNGYYGYCSQSCGNSVGVSKRSQETIDLIIKKLVQARKANGTYKMTTEHRIKLSDAALTKEVQRKKKKTCKERYGIENPGVMGAYASKSATSFIKNFLETHNISETRCFYNGGGVSGKEFYRTIFNPRTQKYEYFSYDLMVFNSSKSAKTKDLNEISLVLEYNGPWHYTETDVMYRGDLPAVPYKSNTSKVVNTIENFYHRDQLKIAHIEQYTKNILIFWSERNQYDEMYNIKNLKGK